MEGKLVDSERNVDEGASDSVVTVVDASVDVLFVEKVERVVSGGQGSLGGFVGFCEGRGDCEEGGKKDEEETGDDGEEEMEDISVETDVDSMSTVVVDSLVISSISSVVFRSRMSNVELSMLVGTD